jgi:GAF domain-containing protein/anti-sigma regulatory factor (Ser/Thr protein kinase)
LTRAKAGASDMDTAAELAGMRGQVAALLEQQTAVAEVLKSISASGFDLGHVLQTVTENATHLSGATQGILYRRDGELLRFAAGVGPSEELMEFNRRNPIAVGNRGTLTGRVAVEKRTINLADVLQDPEYNYHEAQRLGGFRAMLGVPLMSGDELLGTVSLWRTEPVPFTDRQVAIVETFARQAAVAIQNVRLFTETKAALDRQTALGEILQVISASPTEVAPVLEVIARSAVRYCASEDASVVLVSGDTYRTVAHHGSLTVVTGEARPIDRATVTGLALLELRTIHVADVQAAEEFPEGREIARRGDFRTAVVTPLVHGDRAFGAIALRRREVRPFDDHELELLSAFAAQAVIAIENVRLFNETKEALEQQTATADVLKTISRSAFDLQAVFNVVVENATKLCRGDWGYLFRKEGEVFQLVASHGGTPALLDYERSHPTAVTDRTLIGRVALRRSVVHIPDLFEDPDYDWPTNREHGVHTVLGVPILRDDEVIGAIGVARNERRPFSDADIRLVQTFADQATIAMENVRLFSETKEALERQTALAEILRVIADSPADQQPVVDAIARNTTRYCGAEDAAVFLLEGDSLKRVAHHGPLPVVANAILPVERSSVAGRAVLERRTVHLADAESAESEDFPSTRARAAITGQRGTLATPLLREGTAIGVILLRKKDTSGFTPSQIQLVEAFADQAVIAIENVRLFNETNEALERQTSISDVLQTIGRSAFDLQPVLDTVVERAVRLCDAHDGSISTLEDALYRTRSYWSVSTLPPAYIEFMLQGVYAPERGSLVGRTALEGRVVQIADVLEDQEYTMVDMQQAAGYRTVLGVPLLRDGRVIGVFALTRNEVRAFTDRQIDLVRTFADQAAIAIENTRLFAATKEALEQQTAVGEVLKTISRSAFDLQPVLDIVLNNAVRLAGADIGWLSRVENEQFNTVAYSSEFPESVREELVRQRRGGHVAGPWIPVGTGGGLMGFTLAEGRTVHLRDVKEDPTLKGSLVARLTASRTVVGVPMLRDGRSIGGMVLARYEVRPFDGREIELVQTFADQAAIAIENVRLFSETKESLEQQTAVSEVLKTISRSAFELQPVLDTVIASAVRLCSADNGFLFKRERGGYSTAASFGVPAELVEFQLAKGLMQLDENSLRRVGHFGTSQIVDVLAEADVSPGLVEDQKRGGFRTVLFVPLRREGDVLGVISLRRNTVRAFSEHETGLAETFADQAVIAIENARLFNEIQDKGRQLELASRHKSEFLANMSHELRTPLNAIIGFSEVLLQGIFGDVNAKQREYLADVLGSGQHLLSLINDILDLSKIEAGRMDLELSTFLFRDALDSGLTIVRERAARHGIQLNSVVASDVRTLEADERKVKQILYNLLSNAVKFTPDGGRVDVSVRADNGDVRVEVRDTGIGVASEDQERIFEEFRQVGRERSREGTGLGLTLTKRFVELHGGRIWLESTPGQGSTFTFTLPMRRAAAVSA